MAKPGTDSIVSKVSIEVVIFERVTQNEMAKQSKRMVAWETVIQRDT